MASADKQIADILTRYSEPMGGNVWRVQGTAVIYHKTLERIATQAGIRFDIPTVIRAERDEAVLMVVGRIPAKDGQPERLEWSLGEALVNVNYRVSGKQAAYVYAMAEKRGKDRVILKLIELSGLVYSEEEADEFRGRQDAQEAPVGPPPMSVDHMLHEIGACSDDEAMRRLKADPSFRAGYKAADELSRKRIEQALAKAAEEAAA
jgi:hypothetical protein